MNDYWIVYDQMDNTVDFFNNFEKALKFYQKCVGYIEPNEIEEDERIVLAKIIADYKWVDGKDGWELKNVNE